MGCMSSKSEEAYYEYTHPEACNSTKREGAHEAAAAPSNVDNAEAPKPKKQRFRHKYPQLAVLGTDGQGPVGAGGHADPANNYSGIR